MAIARVCAVLILSSCTKFAGAYQTIAYDGGRACIDLGVAQFDGGPVSEKQLTGELVWTCVDGAFVTWLPGESVVVSKLRPASRTDEQTQVDQARHLTEAIAQQLRGGCLGPASLPSAVRCELLTSRGRVPCNN